MNIKDELFYCDQCKVLRYCKKAKLHLDSILEQESFSLRINEDIARQLDNILPIKSTANFGSRNTKHLQQAHDLLRLQDFESASTLYKDLIHENYYHWELFLGISLCCFYTEKYDEAASYADQIRVENNENWSSAIAQYIKLCNNRNGSPSLNSLGSQGPFLDMEEKIPTSTFASCIF